jgi:hypothetical protein
MSLAEDFWTAPVRLRTEFFGEQEYAASSGHLLSRGVFGGQWAARYVMGEKKTESNSARVRTGSRHVGDGGTRRMLGLDWQRRGQAGCH